VDASEEAVMRVRDIMTEGVQRVTPDTSCGDALDLMRQHRIHHLAVMRGGKIVGVLSERDCGGRAGAGLRNQTVDALMTAPAITVPANITAQRAANMMRGRSIGCLVVVERNRVRGIVTVSDLLELIGRGRGTRNVSAPRANLHHRVPHRKQRRASGLW
jgi:acetoin utilization protein AcuB